MKLTNQSIYENVEFQEEPYYKTEKFSIHVPKRTQQNQMSQSYDQQNPTKSQQESQKITVNILPAINQNLQDSAAKSSPQKRHQSIEYNTQFKDSSRTPNITRNRITNSQYNSAISQEKKSNQLRDSLYYDERTKAVPKSTIKNNIIENIIEEQDLIFQNQELLTSIYKIKELGLLKNYCSNINKQLSFYQLESYKGPGKKQYIFNDYHSKSTNNGYSRNFGGLFFNR